MGDRIPYTYRISWTNQDKHYYGVRYAKGCHPEDLFESYFTSSDYVRFFIESHGLPDVIKVTRTFSTKKDAIEWEQRFLTRVNAENNPKFLNRSNTPFGKLLNTKGWFVTRENAMKAVYSVKNKYGGIGSEVPEIKAKVYATNIVRYGSHHTLNTPKVKRAREEANLKKYGHKNPFASKKFYENRVNPMHDPIHRKNHKIRMGKVDWDSRDATTRKVMLEKYGVDHYYKSEAFKEKMDKMRVVCPFGCRDNHRYDVGNFTNHMVKVHGWSKDQVKKYRNKKND